MNSPLHRAGCAWLRFFWRGSRAALLCGSLQAGDYSVTTWGVDEGLPQSSVTDIAQTPDGFIWIRSLNSSLSRFDGVRFVNCDSANTFGLDNSAVRRLAVDGQGQLWVNDEADNLFLRQGNGFVKVGENLRFNAIFDERPGQVAFTSASGELVEGHANGSGKWTWQRHEPPMPVGNYGYFEISEGALWFLTSGGKIGRFVNDQFQVLDSPPGLAGRNVQAITRDAAGSIWVGTEMELARWQNGAFTNANPAGPAQKFPVRRIIPSKEGGLWVDADGKLIFYDRGRWSKPVADWDGNRLPWLRARTIRSDKIGGLWVTLGDEGLAHVDADGELVRVTTADGLPSQLVQTQFADREGNLWAGYHRGGLIQLRRESFHAVTRREGLQDSIVTSVTEDSYGAIWLGTAGGSVARWANGSCTNFALPRRGSFCQDAVVAAGQDGRVWVGTGGNGLLVWEQGAFRHALLPTQIPQGPQQTPQSIRQLLVARNGDVWFANFAGLYRFDGAKLNCEIVPETKGQVVAALVQGADDAIWFGTFDGVLRRLQDGKQKSYQPLDDGPATRFWALCPEADGTLWIGTMNRGLLRFKDGQFTRFTMADGLADDSISHIIADDSGNLWMGSRVGVMCIAKRLLVPREARREPITCRIFGRSDGLPTVAMTLEFQPSCVKALNGDLWFGSPKGASWVNPQDVRPSQPAPQVLMESVRVGSSRRQFAQSDSLASLSKIIIDPNEKNLEVSFTSPLFTAPDLMRFKYRLDKLDVDWIDLGDNRSVTFNHLPAAEYTFRVMARNSDGLWSLEPTEFTLVVEPHLWERKSFQAGALLALLGGVSFTVRRISQQRLRRKLEVLRQQQQIERERARIAQDLHDDLGAGLTEISLTSAMSTNPSLPEHESRQYAREVSARAGELVQRMDEIVWAVNPRNDSVISLSFYACQYAEQILRPLDIACRLDVEPGLPELPLNAEQRYSFFLAFKEAITNVARHSKATELHLAIYAEDGMLVILIEDNGCGFEAGKALAGADGLRNIRERVTRMGGTCEITGRPGQGTHVSMRVPLVGEPAPS